MPKEPSEKAKTPIHAKFKLISKSRVPNTNIEQLLPKMKGLNEWESLHRHLCAQEEMGQIKVGINNVHIRQQQSLSPTLLRSAMHPQQSS